METNREKFDKAFKNFKEENMLRPLSKANEMFIFDDMRILSKDADVCIKNIKNYVTQLEEELKKCKKEPQIKQAVARTYPNDIVNTTEELERYLNDGYCVVMAKHIGNKGAIEYILEKEFKE